MKRPGTLFEVSWEVCHMVGGVHTALSTKARNLAEKLGDQYVMVGPWMLSSAEASSAFEPDPAFDAFCEGCRAVGVPVRVGRWRILGRPRAILVEFSGLIARKDDLLKELWDQHRVDSLFGGWEYIEPVLFGYAAGIVIERWWREQAVGATGPAVAHFHEWMAGAGLLHLKKIVPEIGTIFTAHSTVLGRALAATGVSPEKGLEGRTAEAAAESVGVRAQHSLEAALVRSADVFTAVSDATSEEARLVHGRAADPVLPNGWDAEVMSKRTHGVTRERAAAAFREVLSKFLGEDVKDSAIVVTAGRYEFRNKGFDLLLDACGDLAAKPGRPFVLVMFVPAGHGGVRREVAERLRAPFEPAPALGITTHALFDADRDQIAQRCAALGLTNAKGARVRVVHVAAYLGPQDGVFGMGYEALLQGADLTVYPSFYDAWGYTPQESLALGVPTITTDCSGFGLWIESQAVPKGRGVTVLARKGRTYDKTRARLVRAMERRLDDARDRDTIAASCREIALGTEWAGLIGRYEAAHLAAREAARRRSRRRGPLPAPSPLPARPAAPTAKPRLFPMDVATVLPASLEPLAAIARNLRWTWDAEATAVFRDLSPALWESCRHDALRLLREAPAADLDARASDAAYLTRVNAAHARHVAYLSSSGPYAPTDADAEGPTRKHPVAYICAEYGIHESLPIYSGGLGALSGDHLKSASDMDFPLVAVGLLYRKGYMRQRLEGGTDQRALDDPFDPAQAPMEPVTDADGRPVEVSLHLPGTQLAIRAWRVSVGRIPLYLLDTDLDANRPEDRSITHALYSGDAEHRLRQEIVLGAGGARLLAALGIEPSAWHVNEGHGAFQALERVRCLEKERGLTFAEAKEVVRATTVFTTHTPVPAGHDRFAEDLMRRYFSDVAEWLQVPWERFLAIGASAEDPNGFNMTKLAIEFAGVVNAVSRKHGDVSKELLRSFCPGLLTDEVPVNSVTNGVHLPTWTAPRIAALVREPKSPAGEVLRGEDFRQRAPKIADRDLWKARGEAREALLAAVAARLRRSFAERGDSERLLEKILAGLDPSALYIGFARRFATYKRADLILRDPARLSRILDGAGRPVRLLVAGKAHPRDSAARSLLASVAALARTDEFAGRIIVLEDYDISLARTLVQGVDVWLNNPRPPLEASGTSGMKASANGALNLSIGDGWWLEAYDGTNGWRIGTDDISPDEAKQDAADAAALMNLLEHEVVPLFFDRSANGIPRAWVERVRRALTTVPPVFDTVRMVAEYADLAYRPLARRFFELREDDYAPTRALAARRARLEKGFSALRIVAARVGGATAARPGDALSVEVDVDLGPLLPGDVVVEILAGRRAGESDLAAPIRVPLAPASVVEVAAAASSSAAPPASGAPAANGAPTAPAPAASVRRFEGSLVVQSPGALAYGIRVRLAVDGDAPPAFDAPLLWA